MRNVFKFILMLIIPLVYVLIAHRSVAQSAPMDIKTAINTALTNNRSLRSDSLDISISNSKNKELAGFYKPQVNYSTNTEYNPAIPSQMLPGAVTGQPDKEPVPVKFGTRYSFKSGVEVTQTLYRKDLLLQIKNSGLQTSIAKTKYSLSKEQLVYQVASLFYALQTSAELIRTTQFDYMNLKDVLSIAKAQYENSTLKRIDYESLEINVANKQSQLSQLQTQYNDQLAHFNYLLGIPASNQTVISDSIPEDLQALESSGQFLQRHDIRLSYQLIESKENELKSIRAEKTPAINSYFRYNYQSQFNKAGNAFDNDYLFNASTVGVSISVPLFDDNRRKSRINTAQTQLEQLKLQNQHKQDEARMEVVSATGTLSNSQQQYVITKQNLVLAEKVFSSRSALYTEGVTTLMELLDAERELSNARNLYIQALIDVQNSRLDLHKANGTLLTDFIKSI